jgi:hypothetical protein
VRTAQELEAEIFSLVSEIVELYDRNSPMEIPLHYLSKKYKRWLELVTRPTAKPKGEEK